MQIPADALVTGFTKSPILLERSLAPLLQLRQEGIIRNIHYVTWDSPELDPLLGPLKAFPDVRLTRVPQPDVQGSANQRGAVYQIRNLEAALNQVKDDALILKWRPDFIAKHAFLRGKLVDFARNCAVPARTCFGVTMPAPVFQNKVWIPWADSNQPFCFEDAAFLGMRQDLSKLVTSLTSRDIEILGKSECGSYVHVVRYARPFLARYPLFENYLKYFSFFRNEVEYRDKRLVPHILADAFYLHVLIAHAWILHSQFHVDIGAPDDLFFYANNANRNVDWSRPETLSVTKPYDDCMAWRDGTKAGAFFPCMVRPYGRLMDDAWHAAIFTQTLADFPRHVLVALMGHVAGCGDGRLSQMEAEFYRGLESLSRQ